MATDVPNQAELYDIMKNEIQSRNPDLTDFEPGANLDAITGAASVAGQEVVGLTLDKFAKTFFATANGPAVTGGPDDLQTLAVDHFGETFARPEPTKAIGTVEFTRPTADAGAVTILAGSIVKTKKNAQGTEFRFVTDIDVTFSGLSATASVTAVEAGADSNIAGATITEIETSLTDDTILVSNPSAFAGGDDETDDSEYREFIRNNVERIKGATAAAIKATAENVAGVEVATVIENILTVREWDIGTDSAFGDIIYVPRGVLYVADANGTASQALLDAVELAIAGVKACGVIKQVLGAVPVELDWQASISLNPGGPNFTELSQDTSKIITSMEQYIRDLPIGGDFIRNTARAAILNIWGPTGTGDITDFVTSTPTGEVDVVANEKLLPGNVGIS